ncbi:GGDEF domain-containing protein [Demequina iriomotensis]|uniref:GGDEF domain-containing protein n=1 Tax=Demequina iriomotensis TaxID=1536641 RepID=UPI000782B94D|nr:GGDEF domain-containing protein [Demequina iriomotensis]
MLDPLTLRVALAAVAATLLVLSYVGVYRRDRSRYSAWWTASLVTSGVGTALYLFNGTDAQVAANPVANILSALAAACTWGAARSLSGRATPWRAVAVGPTVTVLMSMLEHPSTNVWAGNAALFVSMATYLWLAAFEMRRVSRERRESGGRYAGSRADRATVVLGIGVCALAAFYTLRALLYLVVGPHDPVFAWTVGTTQTTIALIIALVVVTFTMSEMSLAESVFDLEIRATSDPLTGLWNRAEFERRASARVAARRGRSTMVVADLDHFKSVNDAHGHEAGDRALEAFASAVRHAMGPRDIAGRVGGEEFALLLATSDVQVATARVEALRREYGEAGDPAAPDFPTVSYGVTVVAEGDDLASALRRADAAMYRAKREGRDRVVVDGAS